MPGLNITFEGVAKSIELTQEFIVPWRRKHAQEMAQIEELEKKQRVALLEADLAEKAAKTAQTVEAAETVRAMAAQEREKAKKMQLENHLLQVKVSRAKMELVIEMLNQIAPNLDELTRLAKILELLPHVDVLTASPLMLDGSSTSPSDK